MSEENQYYYWNNYGGISESVSCTSDIYEINPSTSFEHLDATFSNNNYNYNNYNYNYDNYNNNNNINFKDDLMGPTCCYDQDIGEGSLHDIFKDLSKTPLHASQSFVVEGSQNNNDDSHNNHHQNEDSNEKLGVVEGSQNNKEIKRKEAELNVSSAKGKQPIELELEPEPSHTCPCDETRKHLRLKRRNDQEKDRRTRIIEKLKEMQAVLPPSSKTDYASILDNAIKYIKSLKLHLEMFELATSFCQTAYQASYRPPFPTMNVQGAGSMQPWPHVPMIGSPNFPLMMLPPFMSMNNLSFPASQPMDFSFSASQTISPLPQPTYTISNTQPLERSLSRSTSSKRLSRSSSGNQNDDLPNKAISSGS